MRKFGTITGVYQTVVKGCMMQPVLRSRTHMTNWSFGNDRRFMIVGWRPDKEIWDFVTQRSFAGKGIARPQLAQIAVQFGPSPNPKNGYYSLGVTKFSPDISGDWICSENAVLNGADHFFVINTCENEFRAQLWDDDMPVREIDSDISDHFTDLLTTDDSVGPFKVVELDGEPRERLDGTVSRCLGDKKERYGIKTHSTADKYPIHAIFMPSVRAVAKQAGVDEWQVARRFRVNLIIDVDTYIAQREPDYVFSAFEEDMCDAVTINGLRLSVMGKTSRCGFVNIAPDGTPDRDANILGALAKIRREQDHNGAPTFGLHLAVLGSEQATVQPGSEVKIDNHKPTRG